MIENSAILTHLSFLLTTNNPYRDNDWITMTPNNLSKDSINIATVLTSSREWSQSSHETLEKWFIENDSIPPHTRASYLDSFKEHWSALDVEPVHISERCACTARSQVIASYNNCLLGFKADVTHDERVYRSAALAILHSRGNALMKVSLFLTHLVQKAHRDTLCAQGRKAAVVGDENRLSLSLNRCHVDALQSIDFDRIAYYSTMLTLNAFLFAAGADVLFKLGHIDTARYVTYAADAQMRSSIFPIYRFYRDGSLQV